MGWCLSEFLEITGGEIGKCFGRRGRGAEGFRVGFGKGGGRNGVYCSAACGALGGLSSVLHDDQSIAERLEPCRVASIPFSKVSASP